ncbi:MAG: aminoglycoside phosphotransferase family protein [Candidatus Hydrogenedentes bacterium]|nr:aminoglycoside phosphotransferase family protein [Candidatus Hydrogenedentota bacterium]
MKAGLMAREFNVAGRLVTVGATGDGNVNDTYLVVFRTTFSEERFILQHVNKRVFPRPDYIMENMRVVTEHVHKRLEQEADTADRIWQLPRIIPAKDGRDFFIDSDQEYWRAISLIASAHSYGEVQSVEHAYEAGFVLGQFQRLISNLEVDRLHDTLVGFHITPGYLDQLDRSLETPQCQAFLKSSAEAERCYKFIQDRREWCHILQNAFTNSELNLRPIHGDPKISNIMIDDATGRGTCIVDLDTVKPGLIHYDFGDCLRSCCNPAGEEVLDLKRVYFDTDMCEAIVKGYMANAREFLTEADRHYLYDSVRLIAFELGLRFFADFIAGNVYFKTRYDGQNLNRARVQLKLTESIEKRERTIRAIIEKH